MCSIFIFQLHSRQISSWNIQGPKQWFVTFHSIGSLLTKPSKAICSWKQFWTQEMFVLRVWNASIVTRVEEFSVKGLCGDFLKMWYPLSPAACLRTIPWVVGWKGDTTNELIWWSFSLLDSSTVQEDMRLRWGWKNCNTFFRTSWRSMLSAILSGVNDEWILGLVRHLQECITKNVVYMKTTLILTAHFQVSPFAPFVQRLWNISQQHSVTRCCP